MRMDLVDFKQTTFGTAQKDLYELVQRLMSNGNLKKLLYYPVKDALSKPSLTSEQSLGLMNKNIRVAPRLPVDEDIQAYVIISFDNFVPNANNPEFRDNMITFDVICHMDHWVMENNSLRPYLIMGEIDGMLKDSQLNGIGRIDFISANQLLLSEDLAGFSLVYRVINDV